MNPTPRITWHALNEEELWLKLGSGEQGLTSSEIPHRLAQFGKNTLEAPDGTTVFRILLLQVRNPLIYLLAGAAVLSLATGHTLDAAVIGVVVLLNTILGATQEWKADRAIEALQDLTVPHARVLRDGKPETVSSTDVLPGDILLLETGDRVPADARVIESSELHADESALTGESEPVAKERGALSSETQLGDRNNMVWMSTAITAGRGRAVVVETGMDTALGRIAGTVRRTEKRQTPLQERLSRLGVILGAAGVGMAALVFLLGLLAGHPWVDMAMFAVAVAVSAIPEGLPAVISVTLALGVQRMAKRNAVIRSLPAVETLGSTTVICTDKTGTITRNEMTVTRLWTLTGSSGVTETEARRSDGVHGTDLESLLKLGVLGNNSEFVKESGETTGSPTEAAIFIASGGAGPNGELLRRDHPRVAEIPFASEHKYMATLHRSESPRNLTAYVKGAPDRILGFCDRVLVNGTPEKMTDEYRNTIEETIKSFGEQALRVVAGAMKSMLDGTEALDRRDTEHGMVFVGLWGMVDPPRPEAIPAVADAQGAGIRVVMITGDHGETASAIARETGITRHGERVITGAELDELTDDELDALVEEIGVYARVSPEHKLRILQSLKRRGHIVAMTGDGVNDAPALKGADIGVAMGKSGTEVAREASDMILTDDDFATIVHAVEEGRSIFSNLRRVIFFLVTTNLGEILTLVAALAIGLPLPLTAIMILWINLVTDGACTIPLGIEPRHRNVLKFPPRSPREGILDKAHLRRILILAPVMAAGTLWLFARELHNGGEVHARTMAFGVLAAFQWFHALNARSSSSSLFSIGLFSNMWLWGGILTAVALQVVATQTAAGQAIFGISALSPGNWGMITALAAVILVMDEVMKVLGVYRR
jgi:Ca2+-transporting ATPase